MTAAHAARRAAFVAGLRAVGASLPGMAAWGLATGIAMVKVGLELLPALWMTFAVYSGTSQLAVLPLLGAAVAVPTLLLTALVANLRFVVYSATLAPHLRRLPLAHRLAIGFVTIDGPLAALMLRRQQGRLVQRVAFLWGANVATWLTWTAASVAGIVLADRLPYGPELAYLGVLALFGIALPLLGAAFAVPTLLLTALVANLRFVVYSATLAPHLRRLPLPHRLAIGFVTIDGPLAALMLRRQQGRLVQRVAFLWGANVATWLTWTAASVAGIVLADRLPYGPELAYLGVLALFGIALPLLAGRPAWAAAVASAGVAVATLDWPQRAGTVAAVLAGVAAALWVGRERERAPR